MTAAYDHLRFRHQIGYADRKLGAGSPGSIFAPAKLTLPQQEALFHALEKSAFSVALLFILLATAGVIGGIEPLGQAWVRIVGLSAALLGFALTALQAGLGFAEDMVRYQEFRARLELLAEEFRRRGASAAERRQAMEEMEREAYAELRSFLATHSKARFRF